LGLNLPGKHQWDVYIRFVFYCFQLYISSKYLRRFQEVGTSFSVAWFRVDSRIV
jgi:hypothetical protein